MKNIDLLDAIGGLDDTMIHETDSLRRGKRHRTPNLRRWAALAACVGVIAVAGTAYGVAKAWRDDIKADDPLVTDVTPPAPDNPKDNDEVDITRPVNVPTSEKYGSLEELLAYLSTHENHSGEEKDLRGSVSIPSTSELETVDGAGAAVYGNYVYYLGEDGLCIAPLDGGEEQTVDVGFQPSELFLVGDRLFVLGQSLDEIIDLEAPTWIRVDILDLTHPESPVTVKSIEQLGTLTAAYMDGGEFTLVTADGQCACGFSRLDDPAEYKPHLTVDGQELEWGDENISILGEPSRVEYAAVTRVDAVTGEILSKKAVYGEIDDVFYGAGWIVVNNSGKVGAELYTFDITRGFVTSTGKIDNKSLDKPKELSRVSVTRKGGVYRVVTQPDAVLVLTADMGTGEVKSVKASISGYSDADLNNILWEDDRAIVTVQTMDRGTLEYTDRIYVADFSGSEPAFTDTGLTGGHVDGLNGVFSYGNPFGSPEIKSLIPMGGGIYLRHSGNEAAFDIYELGSEDRLICTGAGKLPEGHVFDFTWRVYDSHSLGILHLEPGSNGRLVHPRCSWRVYSVDSESSEPMTLLREYDLGEQSYFGLEVTVIESDGRHFVVTPSGVTRIEL